MNLLLWRLASRPLWTRLLAASAIVVLVPAGQAAARPQILLGNADNLALDQPVVAIEVIDTSGAVPESLGPTAANSYVLDTGATSIISAQIAMQELGPNGYQVVAQYDEAGIGGGQLVDISAPYRFDFAGVDGVRQTIGPVNLLSSTTLNLGGFAGIVGMPAMVDRTVSIDMRGWIDLSSLTLQTTFPAAPVAQPHQYAVSLTEQLFPLDGQINPNDPLPVSAPLPLAPAELRHGSAVVDTPLLVDTGGAISFISPAVAFALGLDANSNGTLDDEKVGEIPIGGVGGTVNMPLLEIDGFAVHTTAGIDLVWSNLTIGVLDVDPLVPGILGMDLLTSGWFERVILGTGPTGLIHEVQFDFRTDGQWQMLLAIDPERDIVVPEPAAWIPALLAALGIVYVVVSRRRPRRRRLAPVRVPR